MLYELERTLYSIQQWISSSMVESDKRASQYFIFHPQYSSIYHPLRYLTGNKMENLGRILNLFSIQLFNFTLKESLRTLHTIMERVSCSIVVSNKRVGRHLLHIHNIHFFLTFRSSLVREKIEYSFHTLYMQFNSVSLVM